jgi:hypothetical protein
MLVSLIGTPWLPEIEDGILVLEDINEHPFRVERMLLQLYHAGILARSPRSCWAALAALRRMTTTHILLKRWSISSAPGWIFR